MITIIGTTESHALDLPRMIAAIERTRGLAASCWLDGADPCILSALAIDAISRPLFLMAMEHAAAHAAWTSEGAPVQFINSGGAPVHFVNSVGASVRSLVFALLDEYYGMPPHLCRALMRANDATLGVRPAERRNVMLALLRRLGATQDFAALDQHSQEMLVQEHWCAVCDEGWSRVFSIPCDAAAAWDSAPLLCPVAEPAPEPAPLSPDAVNALLDGADGGRQHHASASVVAG